MNNENATGKGHDTRLVLYRALKHFLILVGAGLLLKSCVVDYVPVYGNQMSPSISAGDRILMLRVPFLPGIRKLVGPRAGAPVVFKMPVKEKSRGCLRIAAVSGDTVEVDSGVFRNSSGVELGLRPGNDAVIPADYLPRDFMPRYRIPAPLDTILPDSLDLRSFFFAASVIRQDNPGTTCVPRADLSIDGALSNDYIIADFSLYNGRIDSIPASYRNDWFFWDRLREYLRRTLSDSDVTLTFSLLHNGSRLDRYVVRNRFVFLLADNWTGGRDSRYFGPVRTTALEGRPILVLWSAGDGAETGLRVERLGRIIR